MIISRAKYQQAILPEHRGNPLIEALPAKLTDKELITKLSFYPSHSIDETQLDAFERLEYLIRLKTLRQPLPIYLDVFRAVDIAIKEGYSAKNSLSPTTQNYLHYTSDSRPDIEPRTGFFKPKGCGITVIGESGVGKTCMLEQVLGCFPDTIRHEKYQETILPLTQVVWLKVDCPNDSSVRGLCHRILDELDQKQGIGPTKPAGTIAQLISQIEARIKSSFLGILVIDEMQNLNLAKSGGAEKLLGFLHNLFNNIGTPILFCANPPFNVLLSKTLKAARRAESNGYFDMGLMTYSETDEDDWRLFVDELWELQWTNIETPLTEKLSKKLYDESIGNMDLAVRIFYAAQRHIIGTLDERINEALLEAGAKIAIKASRSVTDKLKRERNIALLKRDKNPLMNKQLQPSDTITVAQKAVVLAKGRIVSIPSDLNRPHHPEFAEVLTALQYADQLHDQIPDFDLIQRASEEENPLDVLKRAGVLCEDPLTAFI